MPAPEERAEIIRTLLAGSRAWTRVPLLSPQVGEDDVMMVRGPKGDGYSGADLAALVREAGVRALRRALGTLEEMDSHPGRSSVAEPVLRLLTLMLMLARGKRRTRWE